MRINDGTGWNKDRNTADDPHALHVECATTNSRKVEKAIRTLYSSKQTEFPLKTRLQFVPAFPKLMDMESIAKFRVLTNRQDGWAKHTIFHSTHQNSSKQT